MDEERVNSEEKETFFEKKKKFFVISLGVFTEPSKTFPILVEKKLWILFPICLIFISTFFSTYTFFERVDREAYMMEQFRKSKFASQIPQEQIEKSINDFKNKSSLIQSILAPFFIFIWLILATLIYYFSFLALGGLNTFMQTLHIVFWAELTTFLSQIISIPVILLKAKDQLLNPQEILLTNLGTIIGSENLSPVLFSLLSSLDIFIIWNLILLTLGLAAVSKLSKGLSALVIFSLFTVKVILKTGWIAFFIQ